jgi:hypothetical protein
MKLNQGSKSRRNRAIASSSEGLMNAAPIVEVGEMAIPEEILGEVSQREKDRRGGVHTGEG